MWGIALGLWMLAPRLLTSHHAIIGTAWEWLIIALFLVAAFGTTGIGLGLVVNAPVAVVRVFTGREVIDRQWTSALWTGLCLPFAYLTVSGLIEWTTFNRLDSEMYWRPVGAVLLGHGALIAIVALALARGLHPTIGTRRLLRGLAAAIVLGLFALPWRAPRPFYVPAKAAALKPTAVSPHAPLLLVGLDGANWRTLQPLIDEGRMPVLEKLVAQGVSGDMHASWPPYWSAPAWAAIVTGHGPDATGVHEDLSAEIPGLPLLELPLAVDPILNPILALEASLLDRGVIQPVPTPRSALKRPPIWERASRAGRTTAVIRFPFTYPAQGQADHVVSNRVVNDLWDTMGVRTGERRRLIAPAQDTDRVLSRFGPPDADDVALLARVLRRPDWPTPPGSFLDPVAVIQRALLVQRQMHDTTIDMIRKTPRLDLTMLYVAGLDNLSHALWEYRHPEDFADNPPRPADVEILGPVIDRYLQWFDEQLGELIAAFPVTPNVIVVSDHGEGRAEHSTVWRGWHTGQGVVILAGPDVPAQRRRLAATYFDVLPTMLDLLALKTREPLSGHSLLATENLSSENWSSKNWSSEN